MNPESKLISCLTDLTHSGSLRWHGSDATGYAGSTPSLPREFRLEPDADARCGFRLDVYAGEMPVKPVAVFRDESGLCELLWIARGKAEIARAVEVTALLAELEGEG